MADDLRDRKPGSIPKTAPALRRFSRDEFDAMVQAGVFVEGEKAELIGGQIHSMMGEGFAHADAADEFADAMRAALGDGYDIRIRTRLDIGQDSEVYPDILVQKAGIRGKDRGPGAVPLLVEVAHSSLTYDQTLKSALYAAAGFAEYWVWDVAVRRLWIYRDPLAEGAWGAVLKMEGQGWASPLFQPEARIVLPKAPDA